MSQRAMKLWRRDQRKANDIRMVVKMEQRLYVAGPVTLQASGLLWKVRTK